MPKKIEKIINSQIKHETVDFQLKHISHNKQFKCSANFDSHVWNQGYKAIKRLRSLETIGCTKWTTSKKEHKYKVLFKTCFKEVVCFFLTNCCITNLIKSCLFSDLSSKDKQAK